MSFCQCREGSHAHTVLLTLRSEAVRAKPGNGDTSGKDAQNEVDDDIGRFVAATMSDCRTCHKEEEPGRGCGYQHGGYMQQRRQD